MLVLTGATSFSLKFWRSKARPVSSSSLRCSLIWLAILPKVACSRYGGIKELDNRWNTLLTNRCKGLCPEGKRHQRVIVAFLQKTGVLPDRTRVAQQWRQPPGFGPRQAPDRSAAKMEATAQ